MCIRDRSRISKANMVDGARDYRLMNRKYVDALLSLKEYNRFSKGLFGWVGFKVKWLEFENVNRVAGETKWSFWQLFLYSLDGIVAFSNAPLYMASIAGVFSFIVAIAAMLFIIIRRLVFGDPVAGWASTVVIILFIGGIQLLSIGILGLYLSKLYLEAKDRPIYFCLLYTSSFLRQRSLKSLSSLERRTLTMCLSILLLQELRLMRP